MISVYKKELRLYFSTFTGYLFVAFMLLCGGIFTSFVNLVYYSPNFEYAVRNMSFVLLICIPLLTMRIFADEKKQRTEQLLYMLPVSLSEVTAGKFLALATVTAIPVLIMAVYPVVFTHYGIVNLKTSFSTLFAFFLLECTLCSIGMFASSLTENQLIAAIISFGIILICYMIPSVSQNLSTSAAFAFKAFSFIAFLAAVIVFAVTKQIPLPVIIFAVLEIPLAAVYFKNPSLLTGALTTFANCFALFDKINTFADGIFDITAVIYYISVTLIFLCFTVQSESKRRWR